MNTEITIKYSSEIERKYTVNDKTNSLIQKGYEFNIKSVHPICGELLEVTAIKKPLPAKQRETIEKMIVNVLAWWEEHRFQTWGGDHNVYDEDPDFVTNAKELRGETNG